MSEIEPLTLQDCSFSKQGEGDRFSIIVDLHREIILGGVPHYSNPAFCDHDHYKNEAGDLYVRCNTAAGFTPSSLDKNEEFDARIEAMPDPYLRRHVSFGTETCHSVRAEYCRRMEYKSFSEGMLYLLKEEGPLDRDARDIVEGNYYLKAFTEALVNWVNEFGKMYPEHLKVVRGKIK